MELQVMHAIEFIYSHQATVLQTSCPSVYVQPMANEITSHNRCCHAAARIHRRRIRLEGEPDRRIRLVDIRHEAVRSHQDRLDDHLGRSRHAEVSDHRRSLLAAGLRNHLVADRRVAAVRSYHQAGCMIQIEDRSFAMEPHVVHRSFAKMVHRAASHSPAAMVPNESHRDESHNSGTADQMAGRSLEVQNQSKYRWSRRLTSSHSHRHCSACHDRP